MDLMWIPVHHSWRLNERHYGALQGLNKAETAAKYGDDQVKIWRRSYDVWPPALTKDDARWPGRDARYRDLEPHDIPLTECLKDTVVRFLPCWHDAIAPAVKSGLHVIIAAHGNSLRALVKFLDNISDDDIVELNIPTGVPLVYELDANLKPITHYYLGDPDDIRKAQQAVAEQGQGAVSQREVETMVMPKTMKAAVVEHFGAPLVVRDVPVPDARTGAGTGGNQRDRSVSYRSARGRR